jgi:hypothetical protein
MLVGQAVGAVEGGLEHSKLKGVHVHFLQEETGYRPLKLETRYYLVMILVVLQILAKELSQTVSSIVA